MNPETSPGRGIDLRLAILAYVVALTIQGGRLNGDTQQRLQVAHSFWAGGDQVLPKWQEKYAIPGKNGQPCAWYGMGQSLVMVPFDWASTRVAGRLHLSGERAETIRVLAVTYGLFPLITVLSILAASRLLGELGFDRTESSAGALGLLLGTTFLHYAKDHQENSLIFLLEAFGLLHLIRYTRAGRAADLAVGTLSLGSTILIRLPLVFDVAALSLVATVLGMPARGAPAEARRQFLARFLTLSAASVAVYGAFLAIDRAYQFHRFGSIWSNYVASYGERERGRDPSLPPNFPFNGSFAAGMLGPFFSAGKSVFLFDPLFTAGLVLVAARGRRMGRDLLAWVGIFVALMLAIAAFYARLVFWRGDHAWGDRYVLVPVWMIAMASAALLYRAYRESSSRAVRAAIVAVAAVSVAFQVASIVFNNSLEIWQAACSGSPFIIGQRFLNLAAYAADPSNPPGSAGCIDPEGASWIRYHFTPNFTPFQFSGLLPRVVMTASKVAWLGMVLACALLAWRDAAGLGRARGGAPGAARGDDIA